MQLKGKYKGFLIDLDGTTYRGEEVIPWASEFVQELTKKDIPHVFITNNASLFPHEIKEKLLNMNIQATNDNILTSALAAARYIKDNKPDARVFIIGESPLKDACKEQGLQIVGNSVQADFVLMGMNRQLSYQDLTEGALQIQNGAKFIATNSDLKIPKERGFYPGNGALAQTITACTSVEPLFIGKPNDGIMSIALEMLGIEKTQAAMIGDNYETDICAGINQGLDTIMVLTGVTAKADLKTYKEQPTHIIRNLSEWLPYI